ncbi:MAG: hypothetical protein M1830_004333 [Pleopsidium flavum]|nr:MAG: hypothetical protein M1830_004333 [Pleopsidium flavum]
MFRLWGSGLGVDKVASEKAKLTGMKPFRSPVIDIPPVVKMKRKRSDSEESALMRVEQSPLKRKSDKTQWNARDTLVKQQLSDKNDSLRSPHEELAASDTATEGGAHNASKALPTAPDSTTLTPLQQSIEAQFSLEILLKHNELRLIDQELAKCQIALEQLRRCQTIPFPGSSSQPGTMQQVSDGIGSPVEVRGDLQPRYPAPWGVTDGPYTRHYAKWLIPDAMFDGGNSAQDGQEALLPGRAVPEGRATRGSFAETASVAGKSRSHRGTAGSKLQALSSGYPTSREKAGPLILKRSTDGQLVKLVCLDCRRDNFSSAQGFINHCRIAHNRGFASHDAAAIACGEEIETDESGGMILDSEPGSAALMGFVHPLIRSAHLTKTAQTPPSKLTSGLAYTSRSDQGLDTADVVVGNSTMGHTLAAAGTDAATKSANGAQVGSMPQHNSKVVPAFIPSPQTPHLSALMQRKGQTGDLPELISQAKIKVEFELDLLSEDGSDEEEEATYQDNNDKHGTFGVVSGNRLPVRATMSPALLDRPSSSKGFDKGSRKPTYLNGITPRSTYASPYASRHSATEHERQQGPEPMMLDGSTTLELSPNTIESNPAPSLVSDDGDYEAHTESESFSSAEPDEEDGYLGIEVEHEGDGSETTATDPELANSAKAPPPRRTSALRGAVSREGGEERHVTFVSPSRSEGRRRAGTRKGTK